MFKATLNGNTPLNKEEIEQYEAIQREHEISLPDRMREQIDYQIKNIEQQNSMPRPIRELALAQLPDGVAKEKVQHIDDLITVLRNQRNSI